MMKKMKKGIGALLVLCMLLTLMPTALAAPAPGATEVESGTIATSNLPWRLYSDGTLMVDAGTIDWSGTQGPWSGRSDISRIVFDGPITVVGSFDGFFSHLSNVTEIVGLGNNFDIADATTMYNLFWGASSLEALDLSGWVTSAQQSWWKGNIFTDMPSLTYLTLNDSFTLRSNVGINLPPADAFFVDSWVSSCGTYSLPAEELIALYGPPFPNNAPEGDITWTRERIAWRVSFVDDDGVTYQIVPIGQTATEPDPDPERAGYVFLGWFEEDADESFDFSTVVDRNITLHARFEPETPEVEILKTAPTTIVAGGALTYMLTVTNTGNVELTGLVVTDTLPAQLQNPRNLILPTGAIGSFDGQTLTVELGTLAPGETVRITFVVTAARTAANTSITNAAEVEDPNNPDVGDDSSTTTTVRSPGTIPPPPPPPPPCCEDYPDCDCDAPGLPGDRDFHPLYMIGNEHSLFMPRNNISRAEVATVLARIVLLDFETGIDFLPDGMTVFDRFSDVESGQWWYYYVAWAYGAGFIKGFDDGTFKPEDPITRQEFAALLARTIDYYTEAGDISFVDADDISAWALHYVYTVYKELWMRGDDGRNFNPQENLSRAEAATTINRILERIYDQPAFAAANVVNLERAILFSDVADTAWYFAAVVAATNDHYLTRIETGAIDWKYILSRQEEPA
ncbi:MAG: S-layer homology domain-containing protein [Oscillospiraceae bacterium]|nr:S-layer homology domain-containing protein [Oscillospiraceae bacterium]